MPYELKKNEGGKYSFNLCAMNHEVILTSQSYEHRSSALDGIASVQKNGTHEENFDLRTSKANEPYFVLLAKNSEIIGKSEMYSSVSAAKAGIESVRKNAPSDEIKED